MLHDDSFVAGFLIGKQNGNSGDGAELLEAAATQGSICDIWSIPKYDEIVDNNGDNLSVDKQRARRLTYVIDVLKNIYGIELHLNGNGILCFGRSAGTTHTYHLQDSSIESADYGAHPMSWTSARSYLVVSDSLIAIVAEHPELNIPIVMIGFVRVMNGSRSSTVGWTPISETTLPNYLAILKDKAFDLTSGMDFIDDLPNTVFTGAGDSFSYKSDSSGYFKGLRCHISQEHEGLYIKNADGSNNFDFIGSFDAFGDCFGVNDLTNTSQMYVCGYKREVEENSIRKVVVNRWVLTIVGSSPHWKGLLSRDLCTYDYNPDET